MSKPVLASGEVPLDGEGLLTFGGVVQNGQWSAAWTPDHQLLLAKLTPDLQAQLYDVIRQGTDQVVPKIRDVVPMLTEEQAMTFRRALDSRVLALSPVTSKAAVVAFRATPQTDAPSKMFLSRKDTDFDQMLQATPYILQLLVKTTEVAGVTAPMIRRTWDVIRTRSPRTRQAQLIAWLLLQVEVAQPLDFTLTWDSQQVGVPPRVVHHYESSGLSDESDSGDHPGRRRPPRRSGRAATTTVALPSTDPHLLTHSGPPVLQDGSPCSVCQESRGSVRPYQREAATDHLDPKLVNGPLLAFDYCGPWTQATDGSRWTGVTLDVRTEAIWVTPSAKKAELVTADSVHEARLEWSYEGVPFTLHTDREGVMTSKLTQDYLARHDSLPFFSVPYRHNTNSRAERAVRTAVEGIKATLYASGLPAKLWPFAARHWSVEYNRSLGVLPRLNTVVPVPFGTLGSAILPQEMLTRTKEESRSVPIMYSGLDRRSSGGIHVFFVGRTGRLRHGIILARDCSWKVGSFAFRRDVVALQNVHSLLRCMIEHPNFEYQAICEFCGRTRFITTETYQQLNNSAAPAYCEDMGYLCSDSQDPRVLENVEVLERDALEATPVPGLEGIVSTEVVVPPTSDLELVDPESHQRNLTPALLDQSDPTYIDPEPSGSQDTSLVGHPPTDASDVQPTTDGGPRGTKRPGPQLDPPDERILRSGKRLPFASLAFVSPELSDSREDSRLIEVLGQAALEADQELCAPLPLSHDTPADPVVDGRAMSAGLPNTSTEPSHDRDRAHRVGRACSALLRSHNASKAVVDGNARAALTKMGGSPRVREAVEALARLTIQSASNVGMSRVQQIAAREIAAEKDVTPRAYAVIVPNREALDPTNPRRDEWLTSMKAELDGLVPDTLELCPVTEVRPGDDLLPALLILSVKHDGRLKSRLVACGNFQRVSSQEVYSSVVSHDVWLQALTLSLKLGRTMYQVDISQAFLQTDAADDVVRGRTFLRIPKWFQDQPKDHVWRVVKSIYGLRSAPKSWQLTLAKALASWGSRSIP